MFPIVSFRFDSDRLFDAIAIAIAIIAIRQCRCAPRHPAVRCRAVALTRYHMAPSQNTVSICVSQKHKLPNYRLRTVPRALSLLFRIRSLWCCCVAHCVAPPSPQPPPTAGPKFQAEAKAKAKAKRRSPKPKARARRHCVRCCVVGLPLPFVRQTPFATARNASNNFKTKPNCQLRAHHSSHRHRRDMT